MRRPSLRTLSATSGRFKETTRAEAKASVRTLISDPVARPAFARASAWQAIFRDANTGAGQDFTGLSAVVQLRLRVRDPCGWPSGLQTLTVKSRPLPGENSVRFRGDPPAFARNVARASQGRAPERYRTCVPSSFRVKCGDKLRAYP